MAYPRKKISELPPISATAVSISGEFALAQNGETYKLSVEDAIIIFGSAGSGGGSGSNGTSGSSGLSGSSGTSGLSGSQGSSGTSGQNGSSGSSGSSGQSGTSGSSGSSGQNGVGGTIAYQGSFYDTTTQTNAGATYSNLITFNTVDFALGISIQNGSQITIQNAGTYNLQFSAQVEKTDSGRDQVEIWLRKNGQNQDWSSTILELDGNNAEYVAAWNFLVEAQANDYYELVWHSDDVDMRLLSRAAQTNPDRPAVPSVILTVSQITYTQAGTSGSSGLSGSSGTSGISPNQNLEQTLSLGNSGGTYSILLWGGTAATPSYSFIDSQNTGMFLREIGQLNFSVNGERKFFGTTAGFSVLARAADNIINFRDQDTNAILSGIQNGSTQTRFNVYGATGFSGIKQAWEVNRESGETNFNYDVNISSVEPSLNFNENNTTARLFYRNGLTESNFGIFMPGLTGSNLTRFRISSTQSSNNGVRIAIGENANDTISIGSNKNSTSGSKVILSGGVDLDNSKIVNVATGSNPLDAVNYGQVQSMLVAGSSGTSGISGSSGTSGVDGSNGSSGLSGSSGVSGSSGTSGVSGSSGTSGISGSSGTSGINGSSGTSGINGSSGTSGLNGSGGTSGSSGTSASGVREYATAYLLRTTTTTSAGAGWRLIDNTFTGLTNSLNISYSNNAFTYNGSGEIIVEVVGSVYPNITLASSEQLQFGISKNGATPSTYVVASWADNGTNVLNRLKHLYTSVIATMSTNDYFDIRYNHTGTGFNRAIGVLDGTMTIKTI